MKSNLTLEQKVGALFSMSFCGPDISPETKKHFLAHHFSNYILFAENLTDYRSVANLTTELQKIAEEATGIPAFISTDQEGGMVARLYSGATHFPSNMAVTASGMADRVETMGKMVGQELRALGINMNHAPSVDINNNPANPVIGIRSYSDDPDIVAKMGSDYIRGLQAGRCVAQAKHFPGHGDTQVDSHLGLPVSQKDLRELENMELIPFKAAIGAGVDSIMTAHMLFPKLEPENVPATLSSNILTGLLRERLGFKGLIITDSMSMNAIKDFYGVEKGCVMAIAAGADIVCMRGDFDMQHNVYTAVLNAAKSGELPLARIEDALARQISLKEKYGLRFDDIDFGALTERYPEHEALADEISANSITLLHDRSGLLSVSGKRVFAVSPPPVTANIADDDIVLQEAFAKHLARETGGGFRIISAEPDASEIASVAEEARSYDIAVFGSYNAAFSKGQQALAQELSNAVPVINIALRVPYDAMYIPESGAALLAYEYTNRSVKSVTDVLLGREAKGRVPVSALNAFQDER